MNSIWTLVENFLLEDFHSLSLFFVPTKLRPPPSLPKKKEEKDIEWNETSVHEKKELLTKWWSVRDNLKTMQCITLNYLSMIRLLFIVVRFLLMHAFSACTSKIMYNYEVLSKCSYYCENFATNFIFLLCTVYVFCKCVKFGCVFFLEFLAENHFHKIKCIAKRHLYMLKFIYVQV